MSSDKQLAKEHEGLSCPKWSWSFTPTHATFANLSRVHMLLDMGTLGATFWLLTTNTQCSTPQTQAHMQCCNAVLVSTGM